MKKRIFSLLLAALLILSFAACGKNGEEKAVTSSGTASGDFNYGEYTPQTALKVGDVEVDSLTYRYYYYRAYQQVKYYAEMYSQQGYDMGYDTGVSPKKQSTTDSSGNTVTWADNFGDQAMEMAQYYEAYYNEAIKSGFTLSTEDSEGVQEQIDAYKTEADKTGYDVDEYLQIYYGEGMTAEWLRAQLTKEAIVSGYTDELTEKYKAAVSDDDVEKAFNDNKSEYVSSDVRHILVMFVDTDGNSDNVTDDEKAETLAKAEKIKKEWENGPATENSFIALVRDNTDDDGSADSGGLYTVKSGDGYVQSFLDWSLDESRKPGDCEIIESTYGYHIMYFSKRTDTLTTDIENTIRESLSEEELTAYEASLLASDGSYAVTEIKEVTAREEDYVCSLIEIGIKNSQNS